MKKNKNLEKEHKRMQKEQEQKRKAEEKAQGWLGEIQKKEHTKSDHLVLVHPISNIQSE